MASVRGLKLLLKKGDGASPEQFTAFCSISAKTVNFNGEENTSEELDCDNPEDVAWLVSEMASKRVVIDGSGTLNGPDFDEFWDWWDSSEPSNCQVVLDIPSAIGGRILEGAFKLPTFQLTGNKGEMCQVSITVGSHGRVTKANNVE